MTTTTLTVEVAGRSVHALLSFIIFNYTVNKLGKKVSELDLVPDTPWNMSKIDRFRFRGEMVNLDSNTRSSGIASKKVNYGDQYTKVDGKKVLKPDIEYTTNEGYLYKTDSNGRISSAEAKLQLGKADRNQYAQRTVGGKDRLSNDDGGHLIASIFKGSGDIGNLVPMNAK